MAQYARLLHTFLQLTRMLLTLLSDALRFVGLCLRPRFALAAENLFLRKQLALYQERHGRPGVPPLPPVSLWSGSLAGSTGGRH